MKSSNTYFWAVRLFIAAAVSFVFFSSTIPAYGMFLIDRLVSNDDPAILFQKGEYYFGGGAYDIDRAERYYEIVRRISNDTYPGARYQLSRIAFIKGELAKALLEINAEITQYPNFKRSYYVRGLIYAYQKNFVLAEKDFLEFLSWKKDSWAGWNDLAFVYFSQGDFDRAAAAAWSGLALFPENVWLNNSVGAALLNKGDFWRAVYYLEKAKEGVMRMSPLDWGAAYPGNNPLVYEEGLAAMKASIEGNLTKAKQRLQESTEVRG